MRRRAGHRWCALIDHLSIVAVAALATVALAGELPLELRVIAALLLFVVLPGHLLIQAVFNGPAPAPLERGLLALGCGFVLAMWLALGLHAMFRPLYTLHLLIGANLLNAALLIAASVRGADLRPRLSRPVWPLLGCLAVAASLRLYNLGYSEFQGDEGKVVLRTAALLQGMPDALIAHRKPPGEILLSATVGGGLGALTESTARLPFALAGLAGVAAIYTVGRAMFGPRAAFIAGLLLALNGYFVAFGRILQYPSMVLLLDALAILCLFRFNRGSTEQRGYAVVGTLLMAGSALSALSAVFLLPVAAIALWPRVFGPRRAPWGELAIWLWPLAAALPGLIVVYGMLAGQPSAGVPELGNIPRYIASRAGLRRLYFNLDDFLVSASFYLSSLYVVVLLGASVGLMVQWLYHLPQKVTGKTRRCWDRVVGRRLVLVWLAGPLLTHLLLVRVTWTHWREVFPGLVLLVAASAVSLYSAWSARYMRMALLLAGGLLLMATSHYVYVVWVQPWPEYQLTYPSQRHLLDWTSYDARDSGLFGWVHRHGYKVVAHLVAIGQLPGDYTANGGHLHNEAGYPGRLEWYVKRPSVCEDDASLIVLAPLDERDRRMVEKEETLPGYAVAGQVLVDRRPMLSLLVRGVDPRGLQPQSYRLEDYGWRFDRQFASPWTPIGQLYRPRTVELCRESTPTPAA
jgi:hypothetical protein